MNTKRFLVLESKGCFIIRRPVTSFLLRVGGELHYLGCHAPRNVQRQWKPAWDRFMKQHTKPYKMICLGIVKEVF